MKPKAGPSDGKLYNEDDWNDEAKVETDGYRYSKVPLAAAMPSKSHITKRLPADTWLLIDPQMILLQSVQSTL